MNSKLMKASLAGAAAVALAAGGGTFAAWSDQQSFTSRQQAGTLTLDLTPVNNQTLPFNNDELGPGGFKEERLIINGVTDGTYAVPIKSTLSFSIANVKGTEDGCHATEQDVDANCGDGLTTNQGELPGSLLVSLSEATANSDGTCNGVTYVPVIVDQPMAHGNDTGWASNISGQNFANGTGSYKVCADLKIQLDKNSDNSTQGDAATWDAVFHLQQNV